MHEAQVLYHTEKWRAERVAFNQMGGFSVTAGPLLVARVLNLSRTGAAIVAPAGPPVGQTGWLYLPLVDAKAHAKARVVWRTSQGSSYLLGLEFLNLDVESRAQLNCWVLERVQPRSSSAKAVRATSTAGRLRW